MPFFLISFFSLTMSIFIIYSSYKVIALDRLPIRAYSASGAGKSTLLYILGGLDVPTSGSVFMNGMDISKFNDEKMSRIRRQNIGFVFQFYNLIPNLNVAENIMLPLLLDGKKMRDYKKPLKDILEVVGLSDKRGHTPRELSGGQQQRVAIARALIGNPEILFADEPTGNLDSHTGAEIMSLLQRINKERGQTIIMVTHSPEVAKMVEDVKGRGGSGYVVGKEKEVMESWFSGNE